MTTLTGRTRYREQKRMFGKSTLVLQVEEKGVDFVPCGPCIDAEPFTRWRDAIVEDLAAIGK